MNPPPSICAAFERVNAAYAELPPGKQPPVDGPQWKRREAAIDSAALTGDDAALAGAVRDWENFAYALFRAAREQ